MKRVSVWLTSSALRSLPILDSITEDLNTTLHVTLLTSTVKKASEIEAVIDKVLQLSDSLKHDTITVKPPMGTNPQPSLGAEDTRLILPIAANVELENFHEQACQSLPNIESWEPNLVLAQGKNAKKALDVISKDLSNLKLDIVIDTIEITVSGCCNKCHNTIHIGRNVMGTPSFYRSSMLINGEWVDASRDSKLLPVYNPATGKVFHHVPEASVDEVNRAVTAAKDAFEGWSSLTPASRAQYLVDMADVVDRKKEQLARLEVLDNGKPLKEAMADISDVASCFRFYADLALTVNPSDKDGSPIALPDSSFSSIVRYEPVGVCALIASFNYPMLIATWKVAPCLASGSTCILKPSELTSLTALELAAIAMEVGLPPGVLNVVTGPGNTTGAALIENPAVDKIAFTGSVATGSHVMKVASKKVTKVTLELGGKSPLIVCKDCDIDKILDWIQIGIFFNGGQVCSATSRVLVHKELYSTFLERLAVESKKIVMGNGLDANTQLGPLVSEHQQRKVLDFIAKGKTEGAKLVCGGNSDPKNNANGNTGYFVEPTIFADVKPWMKIWKEEIFGPVLCVSSFDTEAEAIELANDSAFGLAGAVFSPDPETCRRIARSLRCGIVWINCSQPTFVQAPWGGYKQSGLGRELGPWGLQNYLQTKQITSWVSTESSGWSWYQSSKL